MFLLHFPVDVQVYETRLSVTRNDIWLVDENNTKQRKAMRSLII